MTHLKRTTLFIIIVYTLIGSQALNIFAWQENLDSTLSPTSNLTAQSIQQSFKSSDIIPKTTDQSLYKADVQKLQNQENQALKTIQSFSNEMKLAGNPIQKTLRTSGIFKTGAGNFSFDISGMPNSTSSRDKENLYFRSGGLIAYNLWLEIEAKAFLPSNISRTPILVPMQGSHKRNEDLHDQHLHQLWTASLLMAMQLTGEEQFKSKDVAIAGIGNGIDTIFSLQLGAAKTYLFDYNTNLLKMFKTTLPYNTITSEGIVNTKNVGKSFYDLSEYEPVEVDILLANLPSFGLNFLSEFLQSFKPKRDNILVILSGANFSMLTDQEKKALGVLEKFKKNSQTIRIDYDDGQTQIDDDPLTYVYEFDSKVWTSKEMLDAVLAAQKEDPEQPPTKTILAPSNNSTAVLQSI